MNEFTDMPLGNEEENDVFGSELLSDDSGGLSDPGDVRNWLESFDSANLFEGLDAFDLDNAADDAQVDFLKNLGSPHSIIYRTLERKDEN
jgi:hypothetical protein